MKINAEGILAVLAAVILLLTAMLNPWISLAIGIVCVFGLLIFSLIARGKNR